MRDTQAETRTRRKYTDEYIDDETDEYVKSTAFAHPRFRFYLRAFKAWFYPCEECQKKLHDIIQIGDSLYLGNKEYEPAIELSRDWVTDEETTIELERRLPTKEDFGRIYGYNGDKYWKMYQEEVNK